MSPAAFAAIKKFPLSQKVMLADTCPASYDNKVKRLLKKDIIIKKINQNAVEISLLVFLMSQRKGLFKSHFCLSG